MHVYISHREQDAAVARDLAQRLNKAGIDAWNPYEEVEPGDNWAKRTGEALEKSDVIVILLTPEARQSETVVRDMHFALASRKHKGRVLSVLVGSEVEPRDVPWILLKLPHVQIASVDAGVDDVVKELKGIVSTASKYRAPRPFSKVVIP